VASSFWVPLAKKQADLPVWSAKVLPLPDGAEFKLAIVNLGAADEPGCMKSVEELGGARRRWPAEVGSTHAVLRIYFDMDVMHTFDTFEAASQASIMDVLPACSICLDPLQVSACTHGVDCANGTAKLPLACQLCCGHSFHADCLATLIATKSREAAEKTDTELAPFMCAGVDIGALREQQRVRQCPQCHYGPVINENCNDMELHDATRGRAATRTTNSCGKCGFFSEDWSDWEVWDSSAPFSAAYCPVCKAACQVDVTAELLACFETADHLIENLPSQLMRSLSRATDLFMLLLHLRLELKGSPGVLLKEDFEELEPVMALGLVPKYLDGLLQGTLQHLLKERLDVERAKDTDRKMAADRAARQGEPLSATNAVSGTQVRRGLDWAGGCDDEWGAGKVARVMSSESGAMVQVHWDSGCSSYCQAGGALTGRPSIRHHLILDNKPAGDDDWVDDLLEEDSSSSLNRQILDLTLAAVGGCERQEAWISEAFLNRRQSALLLCCAKDELPPSVADKLGSPWLEETHCHGVNVLSRVHDVCLRIAQRQQALPMLRYKSLRVRQVRELRLLRRDLLVQCHSALQDMDSEQAYMLPPPPSVEMLWDLPESTLGEHRPQQHPCEFSQFQCMMGAMVAESLPPGVSEPFVTSLLLRLLQLHTPDRAASSAERFGIDGRNGPGIGGLWMPPMPPFLYPPYFSIPPPPMYPPMYAPMYPPMYPPMCSPIYPPEEEAES